MFGFELLSETFSSICQNKVRTMLAGFGVAWGIFILVLLLGVGQGFRNGVMGMFSLFAQKSMYVYGGRTSLSYKNMSEGMEVGFNRSFLHTLTQQFPEINAISAEAVLQGVAVQHDDKVVRAQVTGVDNDYFSIKLLQVKPNGRLFNELDAIKNRDVAVIGEGVEKNLFGKAHAQGSFIRIDGISYRVVGVLKSDNVFSLQERNSVYIPTSTFSKNFNRESLFSSYCLTLGANVNTTSFEKELKNYMAYKLGFDCNDTQAVFISNIEAQTSSFETLFSGLQLLIWGVGICLLLSGIVGICNIMLVIVKERTNEIGIRKAVGAKPTSVIGLILSESVIITLLSGIVGIILGLGALSIVDSLIMNFFTDSIISHTSINIPVVVFALVVLVVSGVLAGLFPAVKAAQVMPVDAIRYDARS